MMKLTVTEKNKLLAKENRRFRRELAKAEKELVFLLEQEDLTGEKLIEALDRLLYGMQQRFARVLSIPKAVW